MIVFFSFLWLMVLNIPLFWKEIKKHGRYRWWHGYRSASIRWQVLKVKELVFHRPSNTIASADYKFSGISFAMISSKYDVWDNAVFSSHSFIHSFFLSFSHNHLLRLVYFIYFCFYISQMLNLDSSTKEFAFAFFNRNLILLSLIEKEKEKKK